MGNNLKMNRSIVVLLLSIIAMSACVSAHSVANSTKNMSDSNMTRKGYKK